MARRQREFNGKTFSDDGSGRLYNAELKKYLIYRPYPLLVDEVNESDKVEPDNKQEYTSKQLKDKFGTDDTSLINAGKEEEERVAKVEDKPEDKVTLKDYIKNKESMQHPMMQAFGYKEKEQPFREKAKELLAKKELKDKYKETRGVSDDWYTEEARKIGMSDEEIAKDIYERKGAEAQSSSDDNIKMLIARMEKEKWQKSLDETERQLKDENISDEMKSFLEFELKAKKNKLDEFVDYENEFERRLNREKDEKSETIQPDKVLDDNTNNDKYNKQSLIEAQNKVNKMFKHDGLLDEDEYYKEIAKEYGKIENRSIQDYDIKEQIRDFIHDLKEDDAYCKLEKELNDEEYSNLWR